MERGAAMFDRAIFVMDRGYDDNRMFLKLDELKQDYVIRLTAKCKLFSILCKRRHGLLFVTQSLYQKYNGLYFLRMNKIRIVGYS